MAGPTGQGPRSIRVRILAAFVLSLLALAGALGYGIWQILPMIQQAAPAGG